MSDEAASLELLGRSRDVSWHEGAKGDVHAGPKDVGNESCRMRKAFVILRGLLRSEPGRMPERGGFALHEDPTRKIRFECRTKKEPKRPGSFDYLLPILAVMSFVPPWWSVLLVITVSPTLPPCRGLSLQRLHRDNNAQVSYNNISIQLRRPASSPRPPPLTAVT